MLENMKSFRLWVDSTSFIWCKLKSIFFLKCRNQNRHKKTCLFNITSVYIKNVSSQHVHIEWNQTEIYYDITKEFGEERKREKKRWDACVCLPAHVVVIGEYGHFSLDRDCGRDAKADIKHRIKFHSRMSLSIVLFGLKWYGLAAFA